VKNGDECTQADGTKKKGTLTWYVNGKKQSGNPADYRPKDKDQVSILRSRRDHPRLPVG
jgi:hypothetical protein